MLAQTYTGLKVLDLSTNIAGPYAAMILADMGADVTKVERPPTGDDTRALPPKWNDEATVFLAVNRNKDSLILNLKEEADRAQLMQLVTGADVLVESFPPGLGEKLGLTHAAFNAANPRIITCSISAFGDGPIGSKMPGYDALVQAVSGMMSFTGNKGDAPVRLAPSVLDLSTGMWAAMGIMAALKRRDESGSGDHVRPSLIDSAFNMMNHQTIAYLATGNLPEKLGAGAPSAAPYGVYAAQDGDIMIATASEPQFPRLCAALGLDEMTKDARFSKMADRIKNRKTLDEMIGKAISTHSAEKWLKRLNAAGISCGRVNNLEQSLASDVVQERKLFIELDGVKYLRLPIDADGASITRTAPKLDEN